MTRDQKIEWLKNATPDELLRQYETSSRAAEDPFETERRMGISFEEIMENYVLARAEVIGRMTR